MNHLRAALCFALVSACSAHQVGTQTNWLRTCESDHECGRGLGCTCGVCTLVCTESRSACPGLPEASCVLAADRGSVALCGGTPPPVGGLCLQRCEAGDCPRGAACIAGVCAPLVEATDVVAVDEASRRQTLVGFGAGTGWLTDEIAHHPAAATLYDAVFTDLGLDVVRLLNRYDDYGTSDLTTSVDIVSAASERLGRQPTFLLVSSSPPAALKANGSELCSGNADCTLARGADGAFDYPGFAAHWRAILEAYAAAGIAPDYVSIQNHPDWVPPSSATLDACRFLPTEGTATVDVDGTSMEVEYPGYAEALAAVLDALVGLPDVPRVVAPDTAGLETTQDYAAQLAPASIDALAVHMYDTDPSEVDRDALTVLHDLGATSGLPIFHTEAQAEGIGTAVLMHEALSTVGAAAYLQNDLAVSAYLHTPNPTALIALGETDFTLQDPYHAMRHFAGDTDPGWTRVETTAARGTVLATGWVSPSADAVTVILVNPSATRAAVLVVTDAATSSRVTRSVFRGTERSADLGTLPPNGVVSVPSESVVTIALRR